MLCRHVQHSAVRTFVESNAFRLETQQIGDECVNWGTTVDWCVLGAATQNVPRFIDTNYSHHTNCRLRRENQDVVRRERRISRMGVDLEIFPPRSELSDVDAQIRARSRASQRADDKTPTVGVERDSVLDVTPPGF